MCKYSASILNLGGSCNIQINSKGVKLGDLGLINQISAGFLFVCKSRSVAK